MVSKGKKGLKEKKLPKYVRPHLGAFERTLGSAHTTVARSAQHPRTQQQRAHHGRTQRAAPTDAAAARMPRSHAAALTHARSSHASLKHVRTQQQPALAVICVRTQVLCVRTHIHVSPSRHNSYLRSNV
jgi:hypothetical protein